MWKWIYKCLFHVHTCPCVLIISACLYRSRSVRPLTFHAFYTIVADENSRKKERETSNLFKLKVGEEKHYFLSYCLFDKTALLCWGCHMTELTKQTKNMIHSGCQRSSPRTHCTACHIWKWVLNLWICQQISPNVHVSFFFYPRFGI